MKRIACHVLLVLLVAVLIAGTGPSLTGCKATEDAADGNGNGDDDDDDNGNGNGDTALTISSPDFTDGATLGNEHACNEDPYFGDNAAPEIDWEGEPAGTLSFALTVIDTFAELVAVFPGTGGFVHAVVVQIPATVHSTGDPAEVVFAANHTGDLGYYGPCPPPDDPAHTYVFTIWALDLADLTTEVANLDDTAAVYSAIQDHDLASDSITGNFP